MMKFELVLPCYNESQSLEFLIQRAKSAAQQAGFQQGEFRLLMVENGSSDHSQQVFEKLSHNVLLAPWFKMIPVHKNQGYGFGVHMGLQATEAPVVGWSHADQQCDPADAIKAYFLWMDKNQKGEKILIKGSRKGRNWKDIFVSRVFELLARLILGVQVHEMNAQPKVFNRNLLNHLSSPPKTFAFDLYVLYHAKKMGLEILTIPVDFPPRVHGFSNWSAHFFSRYKTILGIIKYMWHLARTEGRL